MLIQLIVAVIVGILAGTITGFQAHNTSKSKLIFRINDNLITRIKSKIKELNPTRLKSKNQVDKD